MCLEEGKGLNGHDDFNGYVGGGPGEKGICWEQICLNSSTDSYCMTKLDATPQMLGYSPIRRLTFCQNPIPVSGALVAS